MEARAGFQGITDQKASSFAKGELALLFNGRSMKKPQKKKPAGNKYKFTPKQIMFINEYMVDLNGTQAAIRAGYSEDTAGSIAEENLKKPEIRKEVDKRMDERVARLGITADNVLADIDIIRRKTKTSTKDKLRALELLAKHLKLITEKHEIDGQFIVKQMGRVVKDGKPITFRVGNAVKARAA